jgi:hypothetical protein
LYEKNTIEKHMTWARLKGILFSGWVSWVVGILMKVEVEVKAWLIAYKLHAFAGRESNYTHRSRR